MFGRGKIIGPILILVGIGICFVVTAFLGVGLYSENLSIPGAALGIALFGLLPLLLFVGVGAYMTITGRREEKELEQIRKMRRGAEVDNE